MPDSKAYDFLTGGGEMAKAIAARDWSLTPLGPIENWSQSLRTTVSLCLASNFPISLAWGPARNQIYNDGYWPICGAKHPDAIGQDFRECWASAWPVIGEAFEWAEKGETRFLENQRMFLDRNGYLEETFFTFSFSPIRDENGGIAGLFHPVTETTARMLSERRTQALRVLASRTAKADSVKHACALSAEILGESGFDLPFTLLYLTDETTGDLHLVGSTGIEQTHSNVERVALDSAIGRILAPALHSATPRMVETLLEKFGLVYQGAYPEQPAKAILLPIQHPGHEGNAGALVAGISPRLPLDDNYRSFLELLAGQLTTVIATARAYEEERLRVEELAKLDRAKTAFFSNVSHEFRTPLTLILGPLEELAADTRENVTVSRDEIGLMYRNGLRLLRLVNSLLDFSRIEADRAQPLFESVDLAEFTTDLASSFRAAVEKAGLEFVVDCPPLSSPVRIDRSMWEKVILNLLSNAFKFTFEGAIRVVLREKDGMAEVRISDTGTGIPADALSKLFERFYRVEGARGRTHEGTGIGLSLVRDLVMLHHGTVEVASEVNAGTTFTVRLPLSGVAQQEPLAGAPNEISTETKRAFLEEAGQWSANLPGPITASAKSPAVKKPRILLADDNADMRRYVERLLADDYYVQSVSDGAEALQAAREFAPDLILSDVMMPGLDGFGLVAALHNDHRTRLIPVILLSARAGEEARVEGLRSGADDYLVKPFGAKELLARVRTHVEKAQLRLHASRENEFRQTAAAMEQQRSLFDKALSHTLDFIFIFDLSGRFSYANQSVLSLYQKPAEEVIGRRFADLGFPADLASKLDAQIQEVIHEKKSLRDQVEFTDPTGETRSYEHIFVPVLGADNDVESVVGSSRDITERKRLESQLRQAQKMEAFGQLAGGVAHDFNNLLTVILGYGDTLQTMFVPQDARWNMIGEIIQAAELATSLTRQLLAFSRQQVLAPKVLDLNTVVTNTQKMLGRLIGEDVRLATVLQPDLSFVRVDPGQMEQVIMNLAVNARDAMPRGGRLTIETREIELTQPYAANHPDAATGKFVMLAISDTGSGMSPEVRARVFEPFFTTKEIGKGTGLGLAVVLGIVKQSGGNVEVYSEPGVGTTFRIYLPIAQQASVSAWEETGVQPLRGSETILLVEDNEHVRKLGVTALQQFGYTVRSVSAGEDALQLLANSDEKIDLLVTDVVMPEMGGRELSEKLQLNYPKMKVLFMSGYTDDAVVRHGILQADVSFLQKPFTPRALAKKVRETLDKGLAKD